MKLCITRLEHAVFSDSCYLNYEILYLHFSEKNNEDGWLMMKVLLSSENALKIIPSHLKTR
jgi:hypothetical protein